MRVLKSVNAARRCLPTRVGPSFLGLVSAALLVGCNSGSGSSPQSISSPSFEAQSSRPSPPAPIRGPHTVEGLVFDAYTGAVANADVNFWVQDRGLGYSYWSSNGRLGTDQDGRFSARNLFDSQITVQVWKPGFVQPCAVIVDLKDSVSLQVELTSRSTLDSLDPPRPQSASGPSFTGVIFETVNGVKYPVAGAEIWAEAYPDFWSAMTISDLRGGYFLCNLPPGVWLSFGKPGFASVDLGPLDTSQSTVLDIELKRL